MTRDEMKQAFRDATAQPPPGARERVWKGVGEPDRKARVPWLFPVLTLAAVVLGVVVTAALLVRDEPSSQQWSDEHSAVAWSEASARRDDRRVVLSRGEVAVSSWGAPVEVVAGEHLVRVESGVAVIRVAGDAVSAEAIEGVLSFDGTRRVAPSNAARTSPLLATLERLESKTARPLRLVARAEQAVAEHRYEDAARAFEEVASSGSLDAEVANYKLGELQLRELGHPERALEAFEVGHNRFPHGALTQERQLSAIESCVKLERWADVERRTSAFLTQHADSERADEVRVLLASALAAQGDWTAACARLAQLPKEKGTTLRAKCP